MKKLLSVLLIVSTSFLSLGFQTCFARHKEDQYYEEYYNKYSTSQNFEKNRKNAEIKKLKKLLKKAEARNEQLEEEKKEKEANKSSLWSKIKNNFSFFFSSYAGIALSGVLMMALGLASYIALVAGYECYNDDRCEVLSLAKNHSFLSYVKNVDLKEAIKNIWKLIEPLLKNTHVVKVEKDKN